MASGGGRKGITTTAAKVTVGEQICQAVQSTSNLLHLMEQSSPSQALLIKLPKNLVAKASLANNMGRVLEQLPQVIASFDEHLESGLKSISDLNTVTQLLSNMENSQLRTVVRAHQLEDIRKVDDTCMEEEEKL